jgi:hypothetical protein
MGGHRLKNRNPPKRSVEGVDGAEEGRGFTFDRTAITRIRSHCLLFSFLDLTMPCAIGRAFARRINGNPERVRGTKHKYCENKHTFEDMNLDKRPIHYFHDNCIHSCPRGRTVFPGHGVGLYRNEGVDDVLLFDMIEPLSACV